MTDCVEDLGPLPHAARIETMAGYGLSADDIALVLDIAPEELKASYARQLVSGHIKANAKVAESLFRLATGQGREAVTAAIFWLKARAHWKETAKLEHAADPSAPLVFNVTYQSPPDEAQGLSRSYSWKAPTR